MSLRPVKQITAVHKNDIEWIISLWLAIHGGDPVPERIGVEVGNIIKGLSVHLPAAQAKAVTAALH
nr:hypothetical protein [Polymorphobacter sp.]